MDASGEPDPPTALGVEALTEGHFLAGGLLKWSAGHYLNGPEHGVRHPKRALD